MRAVFSRIWLPILFFTLSSFTLATQIAQDASPDKIHEITISSIQEVEALVDKLKKIDSKKRILVVFDWDRTLSLIEGCIAPLRETDKTKVVVQRLSSFADVHSIILTSRAYNVKSPLGRSQLITAEKNMVEELFGSKEEEKENCTPHERIIKVDQPYDLVQCNRLFSVPSVKGDRSRDVTKWIHNGDASVKGDALVQLIDEKALEADIIIFVDNDIKHTKNVEKVFRKRNRETVYILYYPVLESAEESSRNMDNCTKIQ